MRGEAVFQTEGLGNVVRLFINDTGLADEKWELPEGKKFAVVCHSITLEKYVPSEIGGAFAQDVLDEFKTYNLRQPIFRRKNVHEQAREKIKNATKEVQGFDNYADAKAYYAAKALEKCGL